MNELEVLEAWHPTDEHPVPQHESAARDALEAAMEGTRPTTGPRRTTGRRFAGRALVAAAVTTALVAGGVAIARRTLDDSLDGVRRVHIRAGALDAPAAGGPINVLVVGSDSRAFVSDQQEADAFGTPTQVGGQRSDTMALIHVDGDSVTAVWLPRDLLVTDASGNRVQLNSFFNAGPEALIDAVRDLTGTSIDHFVEVEFPAFVRIVDDLGGVRMFVPAPMRDVYTGLDVPVAGCTTFDGDEALAWSRSRHAEYLQNGRWIDASPLADLDRIARQQALLRAIGTQTRARIGTDVSKANDVLDTVVPSLRVDAGMTRDTLREFVGHLVRPDDFTALTVPNAPAAGEPGRLEMPARPASEDFFTWIAVLTGRAGPASGGPVGSSPLPGSSC